MAPMEVTASIRRAFEPTELSETILKRPRSAVLRASATVTPGMTVMLPVVVFSIA